MPGAGVGIDTVDRFKEEGFRAIHLSGTKVHQNVPGTPKVPMNSAPLDEGSLLLTHTETVHQIVARVK